LSATKEDEVKKSVVVKLPVTIDVDPKKHTYSIEYGKVAPVIFEDGIKIQFSFGDEKK
jgi:hypothetical protein